VQRMVSSVEVKKLFKEDGEESKDKS
jgi:hypothetical protein